jgi:hypothetical protein
MEKCPLGGGFLAALFDIVIMEKGNAGGGVLQASERSRTKRQLTVCVFWNYD